MCLPDLSRHPRHHSDCCLSLSTILISHLSDIILSSIRSGIVLSIGSGTGLLEAHLDQHFVKIANHEVRVEGVEIKSTVASTSLNGYLPEELSNTVGGTWAICDRVVKASGLMFVYPRTTVLVEKYLEYCTLHSDNLDVVIWLGPIADWYDFDKVFKLDGFDRVSVTEPCGLVKYEMLAVLQRRSKA